MEMIVSITVHVFNVCVTDMLKYSFTSQKPPSLTWDSTSEPAPIATTTNSSLTPGTPDATGRTTPAAVAIATVAEPVAIRMSAATNPAKNNGDKCQWLARSAIAAPTPLPTKTSL